MIAYAIMHLTLHNIKYGDTIPIDIMYNINISLVLYFLFDFSTISNKMYPDIEYTTIPVMKAILMKFKKYDTKNKFKG